MRGPREADVARLYTRYAARLRALGAVDFDDLLGLTVELFTRHPDVLDYYRDLWRYVLVDEYQDTNAAQYRMLRQLTAVHRNLCVVGDPDQSIYRFRGADLRNILDFERDFPGCRVVRLEQNYRSTGRILEIAAAVIAHNQARKEKSLWTENVRGEAARLFRARDETEEALWVARTVAELRGDGQPLDGVAVLYRTNAQSRVLEDAFRVAGLPYHIVGSVRFYERREIKDALAYLRLVTNPADDLAFRRALGAPPRGIGRTTLGRLEELAAAAGAPLLATARARGGGDRGAGRPRARGVRAPDRTAHGGGGRAAAARRAGGGGHRRHRAPRGSPPREHGRGREPAREPGRAGRRRRGVRRAAGGRRPRRVPRLHHADRGRGRASGSAPHRDAHDAALGQGPRVPRGVPHRARGGRLPARPRARRRGRDRGGAPAGLRGPHPREGTALPVVRRGAPPGRLRGPARALALPARDAGRRGRADRRPASGARTRPAGGVARPRVGARAGSGPRSGRRVPVPRRARASGTPAGATASSPASRRTARTSWSP